MINLAPCCCAGNCYPALLIARAFRHGFVPLDVGWLDSVRRFLTKNHTYTSDLNGTVTTWDCLIEVTNQRNGKWTDTTSGTLSAATINSDWSTHRTKADGLTWITNTADEQHYVEITRTYDGSTLVGIDFHLYRHWKPFIFSPYSTLDRTWTVTLEDEHTLAMLIDVADELLAVDGGVLDVPDNLMRWATYTGAGGGVYNISGIATDPAGLPASPSDPAYSSTDYSPSPSNFLDSFGAPNNWWQHSPISGFPPEEDGGDVPYFSVYYCTFEDEATWPTFVNQGGSWANYYKSEFRLNVNTPVCVTHKWSASAPDSCAIFNPAGGKVVITSPDPVSYTDGAAEYIESFEMTAPGYLTGGGCPCTNAP